ncbi:hypothetical protein MC885_021554, partial [Smutsia gigantea]
MCRCPHGQNSVLRVPCQTAKPCFLPQGTASPLMGGQVSSFGSFRSLPGTVNTDWMSALCPQLWDVPIHHLSIPGSHDMMTYCLNKKSSIYHDQSWLLQLLDNVLPCITLPVVMKWSVTQTLNVTEQLDTRVQYLDLRIAHMLEGSERNLHFVHLVYTTALVEDTLTEVSDWLEQHLGRHDRGPARVTDHLHPEHLWGHAVSPRGQQVFVSYEDECTVSWHGELWPRIPYWWGDQVKPEELIHYLECMRSRGCP